MKESPSRERYIALAQKWLNGTITPEEEQEYAQWYNTLDEEDVLEIPASVATDKNDHRKKLLRQINNRKTRVISLQQRVYRISAVAALLIVFIGAALYYYTAKPAATWATTSQNTIPVNDIGPGVDGAILTLGNGKSIILDTVKNGSVYLATYINATKKEGSLAFENLSPGHAIEYYTLTTPKARQQKLILPDGTALWLNAVSSVRFPNAFTGKNREVEISGEAYFEVAKDPSRPFIVKVKDAAIEVLGTHFNVMAYNNESTLQTTLLEGSVKFSGTNRSVMLTPGQQSELYANGDIHLNKEVDVDMVTAWKNGMQSFNNADIKTIMRQVERWYDVDITYSGDIPAMTFSGDIPRSANLSEVLKLFKASKINFEIDKNMKKLTVKP